jgi:hypothetical protein
MDSLSVKKRAKNSHAWAPLIKGFFSVRIDGAAAAQVQHHRRRVLCEALEGDQESHHRPPPPW